MNSKSGLISFDSLIEVPPETMAEKLHPDDGSQK